MRCITTLLAVVVVVVVTAAMEVPLVDTEDGRVSGILEKSVKGRDFHSFYGIPFAQPPLGKLRFKDPVTPSPWEGTRNASTHPAMCLQDDLFDLSMGKLEFIGEEDCLYLNVFAPEIREVNSLPVMVYIHGGGFYSGSATEHRPHVLLDHDIVLVVVQYRLGVLGFLSTEDSVMPGNLGLKDQTMALQWVKRNVHHFGGDNTRITIFGNSAGGASVHFQMLTPKAKGLFSRAILQSGTALCPWAVNPVKPREWAHRVADVVGCPTDRGSQTLLDCLQELDANVLAPFYKKFGKWKELPFTMIPWMDGEYLPEHPAQLVLEGRHAQVDIISGVNIHEGAVFALPILYIKVFLEELQNNFSVAGPVTLELSDHNDPEAVARQVYLHYLGTTHVTEAHEEELVRMFSDRLFFVCHDLTTALHAANLHPTKKTFRYELQHRGQLSFSNILCPHCGNEWVFHADDLFYLFAGGPLPKRPSAWPQDLERLEDLDLRNNMTTLWTNFAATGNPTPDDGLGFKWEPSTADSLQYLSLTPSPSMQPDTRKETREFYSSLPLPENLILQTHLVDVNTDEPKGAGDSPKTEL